MKKVLSLILTGVILCTAFSGCGKKQNDFENYSIGLNEFGFYENLESNKIDAAMFNDMEVKTEDVLQWLADEAKASGDENLDTVDEYVYEYATSVIRKINTVEKEVVEEGDIVTASLEFFIDNESLEDYKSTRDYTITKDSDVLVSSFNGHKKGDKFETKYKFADDDKDYPGKEAVVKVSIDAINYSDPLGNDEVFNANLEEINKLVYDVKTKDEYLEKIRPVLAVASLDMYLEEYVRNMEITVPEEYTNYEFYRLKARLTQIGYTYDQYLSQMKMTEEDVLKYCEQVARENLILMSVFSNTNRKLTNDDLTKYFGEQYESIKTLQGTPYMYLRLVRDYAVVDIANVVNVTWNGEPYTLEKNQEAEKDTPENATEATTQPSEASK